MDVNQRQETFCIDIADPEANGLRIALVEKFFNLPTNKLAVGNRALVGEGVLTKICRRKPKLRHFFLFSDILLYGRVVVHRKVLRNPQTIELCDASVQDVADNGIFRHGFTVLSPKKSFTLYASAADEKLQWINHLNRCIYESQKRSGYSDRDSVKKSPVWIPDSEASHCMVCGVTEFTMIHRRHHCRHCGKVVCDKCSPYRWLLPYQGSSKLRVCRKCHHQLQSDQVYEHQQLQQQLKHQQQQQPRQPSYSHHENQKPAISEPMSSPVANTLHNAEPTFIGNAIGEEEADSGSDTDSETPE